MLRYFAPLCIAAAMFVSVQATAAETPKPTMDLEILSNGQLVLRGEIIDGIDDLEAKLRIMRAEQPPFELSLKLPKTFSFESIASMMKVIQDMGLSLGLIGNSEAPNPAPVPLDSTI